MSAPAPAPEAASVAVAPAAEAPIEVAARPGSTGAGLGLLIGCAATGAGIAAGGIWGGLAGFFYAGAARNAYRAYRSWSAPEARGEATKSATVAVFGGFLAVVATVQAVAARKQAAEAEGSP